jgi:hypothetical protein
MRRFRVVLWLACAALAGCDTLSDDTGTDYPGQWWPWVCADGGLVPDGGCPVAPGCPESSSPDGSDGGC